MTSPFHNAINFLKDAVTRGAGAGVNGCYVVHDGHIHCRNISTQAGVPWDAGASFAIPADALDAALGRITEISNVEIGAETVVIKGGRMRSTIKLVHDEAPPIPDPIDYWIPSPPGLAAALNTAKGFCGDRRWQIGVRLMNNKVTAFSGKAGIDIDVPDLVIEYPFLLIAPIAAYIGAQGDPDEMAVEPSAVNFRWKDGRWVRCQFLADEMPEDQIESIFENAGETCSIEVTQEWRDAAADAEAMSDGTVKLTFEGLTGIRDNITSVAEFDTGLESTHSSSWNAKSLIQVLEVATAWQPQAYPYPALFLGKGLRGVIQGWKR